MKLLFTLFQTVCLLFFSTTAYADQTIKIGIYQNIPLCFINDKNQAQGIYIDVLEYIGRQEGWKIEYIIETWNNCLEMLQKKQVHLMCGIAYTAKRAETYFFNKENIIVDWGQIYLPKNSNIQSIIDMRGKKVATVERGILLSSFQELINKFDIECEFVKVKNTHDVLFQIENGLVDAGTVLRLFGIRFEHKYNVKPSPIMFAPLQLRFAASDTNQNQILDIIDKHLVKLKHEKGSILYKSIDYWLMTESKNKHIPDWLLWIFTIIFALTVLLFIASCVLKRQIAIKTAQLQDRNKELKNEILIRKKIEHALHESEKKIKASLQEKEVLLREIYHRTKNNMQVIRSMLALQSEFLKDNHVKNIFKDTENRIQSMALVHQKLYLSQDLSQISLKDYINELAESLMASYRLNEISWKSNIDDIFVVLDVAIPCGLILNELFTNSLKYAFPEKNKGEISIILKKTDNNEIFIRFADNGIGFPKNFDYKKSETLGIRIVYSIVEHQLKGKIDFDTNNGVICQIVFNYKLYQSKI